MTDELSVVDTLTVLAFGLRPPAPGSRVYKEECLRSFVTPYDEGGLYTNLTTFQSFSRAFLQQDVEQTGTQLYLHQSWVKVKVPAPKGEDGSVMPTKMAIGVEGGFQVDKWETIKTLHLYLPATATMIPYPGDGAVPIPSQIVATVEGVLAISDVSAMEGVSSGNIWEEKVEASPSAENLVQLPCEHPIDLEKARCADSGLAVNLWLNLSTGYIGSGRAQVGGLPGTGAAARHYEDTGRQYPLAVKLGTITQYGADVYDYKLDKMVLDPHLEKHLAHWGLNMKELTKTEKTMDELAIQLNMNHEWSSLTEAGANLTPLAAPEFVGLKNLGNSCYFNSVMQVLFSLPEFRARYLSSADGVLATPCADAGADFHIQMAKLAVGLLTERYVPADAAESIRAFLDAREKAQREAGEGKADPIEEPSLAVVAPGMLKALLGQGHPEFSTKKQQDAAEYFQYLLEKMGVAERNAPMPIGVDPSRTFMFRSEVRLECNQSHRVSYQNTEENMLSLRIPMEACVNREEFEAYRKLKREREERKEKAPETETPVLPVVPFNAVLNAFAADEVVEGFRSPVTNAVGTANRRTRFGTFPRYLAVQLRRYLINEDWSIEKLEALVDMPQTLDLDFLRGSGLQPGEQQMEVPSGPQIDQTIVEAITGMGFSENAGKRAALATNNNMEAAMSWVLEHMGDDDVNDPLPAPGGAPAASSGIDQDVLAQIVAMGVSERHAYTALRKAGPGLESALDWAFTHDESEDIDPAAEAATAAAVPAPLLDGAGSYRLKAIISHMGKSTGSGHYVCHVRKGDKWVLFNDEKVLESKTVPYERGYLYFYERVEA